MTPPAVYDLNEEGLFKLSMPTFWIPFNFAANLSLLLHSPRRENTNPCQMEVRPDRALRKASPVFWAKQKQELPEEASTAFCDDSYMDLQPLN